MSNLTINFQNKIRKYHSLPEAVVIDYKTIGYPFYVMILDLTYLSNRNLELQEEFVIKCITNGLVSQYEISNFLGVDDHFVEKVLSGLISKNLVTKEENFRATEIALDALERQTVLDTVSETETFYVDALNGKLYDYFQVKKVGNNDAYLLKAEVLKPRKGKVEDIIDYYEEIEKVLGTLSRQNRVELIQVNNIEKVYTQWHEVILVFYKNHPDDTEVGYETFSRDSIQVDYRKTIEQLYAQGQKVLNDILRFDISNNEEKSEIEKSNNEVIKGVFKDDVQAVERLSIKINALNETDSFTDNQIHSINEQRKTLSKQLKEIKTQSKISEIIHTSEHRNYLFQALKEAKNRIMIISPWIRSNVVDNNFLAELEDTLVRECQVYILYGIKQKSGWGQQNDPFAIKQLEDLARKYKNFQFDKVKNTHRKIIVCDDKFGIVTSFNFLSFRADPSLTYRDELGVILRDKETVDSLFQSGLSLLS
ncbi:MAG: phospholipase D-like domain-containing protein [Nostoc sp. ZfuVER08]|nr:phospholipase D-like domain-containing protein [Nostoc sp. ZfuVER08]